VHLPTYEDGTECSETSAYKIQTPGNHPKESIQHSGNGESLKSRIISSYSAIFNYLNFASCKCIYVCVCVCAAKQILLPVREREMESTPCDLRTKLCTFSRVCAI